MAAVDASFEGGPVDGRLIPVETTVDGQLPKAVLLPQGGAYIGASDEPAPTAEHRDVLVDDSCDEVTYRYNGSIELPECEEPEPDNAD